MSGHISVLPEEVVSYANLEDKVQPTGIDVTFGLGGHAALFLQRFPQLKLIAIDKDDSTRIPAYQHLRGLFGDRITSYKLCFSDLDELESLSGNKSTFDYILADLGISSVQLDDPSRGLSFRHSASLDMRMDQTQTLTAEHVLNTYSERELFLVFARGGVGARSKALAKAICNDRPIMDTSAFKSVCNSVLKSKDRSIKGSDLATVPFQAVRIEVNNEFENLKEFLIQAVKMLKSNGRLLVISFHSLEDKLVTSVMRWWSLNRGKGLHHEDAPLGRILTKKAITPTDEEVKNNPRSRSALLRVFERNDNSIWKERTLLPH